MFSNTVSVECYPVISILECLPNLNNHNPWFLLGIMSVEPSSSPIHFQINDNGSNAAVRRERPPRACTARSAARLYAAAEADVSGGRKHKSRVRSFRRDKEEEEEEEEAPPSPPNPYSKIVTPLVREPPLSQLPRWSIRSMWELAAILNFFNVSFE